MSQRTGPRQRFFDVWSRFYDVPLVQRLTYRREHDAVLRRLRPRAPHRVLDVACGTGLLAQRLRRELPGARVVGCDFSRGMLARAAAGRRATALVRASALALPFAEASFDALVNTEAFHWFPDPRRALGEFRRVLAPGGRLYVSLVNPPFESVAQAAGWLARLAGEPARWPTPRQMRRLVEEAGFEVESQSLVLRVPGTLLLPSILTVAVRSDRTAASAGG